MTLGAIAGFARSGSSEDSADHPVDTTEITQDENIQVEPEHPTTEVKSLEEILNSAEPTILPTPLEQQKGALPRFVDADARFYDESGFNNCESINVELPSSPDAESIIKGSKTEFALSYDEFEEVKNEVLAAESLEQIQSVTRELFKSYRVKVSFNNETELSTLSIDEYKTYITSVLSALKVIPADMLIAQETHNLVLTQEDLWGVGINAAGQFESYSDTVELDTSAVGITLVHEWGHAVHDFVCSSNLNIDPEFSILFDEAIEVIKANPRYNELVGLYNESLGETVQMSSDEMREFDLLHNVIGLDRGYGSRNYAEMFAVVFEDIVSNGYINPSSTEGEISDIAYKIQELVIERMQAAMPKVDVSAWLQYVSYLSKMGLQETDVPIERIVDLKPSSYDLAFSRVASQGVEALSTLRPAVALVDGDNTEFIYSVFDENNQTLNIEIKYSGDAETDAKIAVAAEAYLSSFTDNNLGGFTRGKIFIGEDEIGAVYSLSIIYK